MAVTIKRRISEPLKGTDGDGNSVAIKVDGSGKLMVTDGELDEVSRILNKILFPLDIIADTGEHE